MKTFKQVLSISMSAALALTSMPWTASAVGPMEAGLPSFVKAFTPAEQLGYVASSYSPSADIQRPRLIIVTNLHGHVEVQHHILGILDKVVPEIRRTNKDQSQKVPLFVEGGWEKNLEEPLKTVANPDVRKFMAEYFMEKSEMGPLQAYSEQVAGSNSVTLTGVENKDEYLANKDRFAQTYPERKALLTAIVQQESAIKVLTDHLTGNSYQYLQAMRDAYNAGRVPAERYAKALLKQANRFHITGNSVEVLKHSASAGSGDFEIALTKVYREVLPNLAEGKPLTSFLRKSIDKEDDIRHNLAKVDGDLDLLKRLIGDQLTPNEVSLALGRMPQLIQVAQLLVNKEDTGLDVTKVVRDSFDFYPFALLRDDSLAANSIANLDAMGPDATGVLVVGGFHADAIADTLRSHQIPYMIINPTISRDLTAEEQLNYIKRISGDHVTTQEFQQDLTWLKSGNHKVSESAIGAESDLDKPTDVENDKFMGGYAATVEPLLAPEQTPALRALMVKLALQEGASQIANTPITASQTAQANILAKAAALTDTNGKLDINLGLPSLRLIRQGGQFVVEGGVDTPTARNAVELLNRKVRDSNGTFKAQTVDIMAVNDEHLIRTKMDEASVSAASSEHPVIFAANSRVEQLGTANPLAVTAFDHEFDHIVNGKNESATTLHSIASSVLFSAESQVAEGSASTVYEGVQKALKAITPQIEASALPLTDYASKVPTLAAKIKDVIDPSELHSAQVKKVEEELAKEFPDMQPYAIAQSVEQQENGFFARLGVKSSPAAVLVAARGKLAKLRQAVEEAGKSA